ncbi:bifunctional folylpolyglutamate synthase/dihydrofolate synthase [Ornithinimicrobium sp. F0845]|uniref:bifunctional folylpolyglutamate synthase/dihydrofolate synthase n=1 Tax=Ornithinimicrobium sp. F0845 TaxID=2926412 RepID=UPI001FF204A3|nr:folylpolyglutamate synthase/dihydrofolate synthase family protein [Ornithinimicrobium sp. F0845]MCK0111542.1 bifunctional folylpolyglutamate synthase/dihydrofolate synthase [Ornithinimicrobium sp. F0845]
MSKKRAVDPEVAARMAHVTEEILSRSPENVVEPTLDRVAQVMDLLGQPQHTFGLVHITGTNGKTSTTRMVERLLRELGLTTGRFTSPHLHDLRERIAIGGEPIDEERFLAAYDDVLPYVQMVDEASLAAGGPRITYFELLVIVAYAVFSDAPVDVAVVEVGLGGVWDATNVADGQVAVVAPVAIDHTRLLGDNIIDIATEKAGIIKSDAIAVLGVQEDEVMQLLLERCDEVGAAAQVEGLAYGVLEREVAVGGQLVSLRGLAGDYTDVFLPLFGAHQVHNAAMAVAAVEAFVGGGEQPLDADVVRAAFADVTSPGRLEIVRRSPTVIVDAAHNPAGVAAMADAIRESFTFHRLVGVVAVLQEKDASSMLEVLEPLLDHIVVSRSTSPRSIRPERLGEMAVELFGEDRVTVVPNLPDALDLAAGLADEGGVSGAVLATGSITTVADVRMLLGADQRGDRPS